MPAPEDRTQGALLTLGARYTPEVVGAIQVAAETERKLEHHAFCRKETLKEKLELPGSDKKHMIFQVDNHFQREKNLRKSLVDLGLGLTCDIHSITTPYVPAVIADPNANPPVAGVPEQDEIYATRDWFDINQTFTQAEIKAHCCVLNHHPELQCPASNSLSLIMILNNCKPNLALRLIPS